MPTDPLVGTDAPSPDLRGQIAAALIAEGWQAVHYKGIADAVLPVVTAAQAEAFRQGCYARDAQEGDPEDLPPNPYEPSVGAVEWPPLASQYPPIPTGVPAPAPGPGDTTPTAAESSSATCAMTGCYWTASGPRSGRAADAHLAETGHSTVFHAGLPADDPVHVDTAREAAPRCTCRGPNRKFHHANCPKRPAAPPVPPGPEDAPDTAAIRALWEGFAVKPDVASALHPKTIMEVLNLCDALDAARATITARDGENSRLRDEVGQWRETASALRIDFDQAIDARNEWQAAHASALRDREAVEQEMDRRVSRLNAELERTRTELHEAACLAADRFDQLATVRARTGHWTHHIEDDPAHNPAPVAGGTTGATTSEAESRPCPDRDCPGPDECGMERPCGCYVHSAHIGPCPAGD